MYQHALGIYQYTFGENHPITLNVIDKIKQLSKQYHLSNNYNVHNNSHEQSCYFWPYYYYSCCCWLPWSKLSTIEPKRRNQTCSIEALG